MNKKDKRNKYKSITSIERQELIKKKNFKGIEAVSAVPNKRYKNKEIYELFNFASYFPEFRERL